MLMQRPLYPLSHIQALAGIFCLSSKFKRKNWMRTPKPCPSYLLAQLPPKLGPFKTSYPWPCHLSLVTFTPIYFSESSLHFLRVYASKTPPPWMPRAAALLASISPPVSAKSAHGLRQAASTPPPSTRGPVLSPLSLYSEGKGYFSFSTPSLSQVPISCDCSRLHVRDFG